MNWAAFVVQAIIAILGAAGLREIITAIFKRKAVKVEVAQQVNKMAAEWAADVNAQAREAVETAAKLRVEYDTLNKKLRQEYDELNQKFQGLRGRVWDLEFKLRVWSALIMNPKSTIEDVRQMVSVDQGNSSNGSGPV